MKSNIMNLLKRCNFIKLHQRNFSVSAIVPNKFYFENLSLQRSLVRLSGNEVHTFLQGLITNDINHVKPASPNDSMFTMFLNKQGRVICDAIIYKCKNDEQTVFIECDRLIDEQLMQHLKLFRVRKKISIETINDELCVWSSFDADHMNVKQIKENLTKFDDKIITSLDPRLKKLGMRLIAPSDYKIENFQNTNQNIECLPSTDQYNYTEHRYAVGISEGTIEIATLKCFPFEANCDYLHGISFHKGCYLGQEFTARTYHTGVIRKRLMPIILESVVDFEYDAKIMNENNKMIGKLKGCRNKHAIGVLNVDEALKSNLKIGTINVTTHRPDWWPKQQSTQ